MSNKIQYFRHTYIQYFLHVCRMSFSSQFPEFLKIEQFYLCISRHNLRPTYGYNYRPLQCSCFQVANRKVEEFRFVYLTGYINPYDTPLYRCSSTPQILKISRKFVKQSRILSKDK